MTNPVTINVPEGLPFIEIEREFDAPVEAALQRPPRPRARRAVARAERLRDDRRALGLRVEGRLSLRARRPRGRVLGFNGTFHTVRENEFAVQTFEFEGFPDVVAIESMTFEDLGNGRSRLQIHSVYPTVESRDGMVASGMERGCARDTNASTRSSPPDHERADVASRRVLATSARSTSLNHQPRTEQHHGLDPRSRHRPGERPRPIDRVLPRPGRLRPRPRHPHRRDALRAAHAARLGVLDRHRHAAVAAGDGSPAR